MDHFKLGEFEVSRIEELVDRVDCKFMIPDLAIETLDQNAHWLSPSHYSQESKQLPLFIQSWLIRSTRCTILVDACCGNGKPRPWYPNFHNLNTRYLDLLKATGCTPEDVDFVLCTHLHPDHVGWNTRLESGRWIPTFPKARYLISRKECALFAPENRFGATPPQLLDIYEDSVLPVIEAGQVDQVDGVHQVTDSIILEPAPGHTPGHCIVRAGRQGETALFSGDAMHNPIQIAYPELNTVFCAEPAIARQTRLRILEDCAENGHLLVPGHFGPPHVGRIRRREDRFSFEPGLSNHR